MRATRQRDAGPPSVLRRPTNGVTAWLVLWGPVALYMALIFLASSRSNVQLPGSSDKLVHALAYMPLSALLVRALARGSLRRATLTTVLVAVGITIAYGASDEWHQRFVEGRVADGADVVADAIGGMLGAAACWAWGTIAARSDV